MKTLHHPTNFLNSENASECQRLLARWEARGINEQALARVRERFAQLSGMAGDARPSTFSYGGRI